MSIQWKSSRGSINKLHNGATSSISILNVVPPSTIDTLIVYSIPTHLTDKAPFIPTGTCHVIATFRSLRPKRTSWTTPCIRQSGDEGIIFIVGHDASIFGASNTSMAAATSCFPRSSTETTKGTQALRTNHATTIGQVGFNEIAIHSHIDKFRFSPIEITRLVCFGRRVPQQGPFGFVSLFVSSIQRVRYPLILASWHGAVHGGLFPQGDSQAPLFVPL
mmetsp:Transcript_15403/g.25668  ORF Transcript_15403/g.25668 Transcript_15403/m.25668 type:complete len:219 (+) Transcript_15403:88-744(+)